MHDSDTRIVTSVEELAVPRRFISNILFCVAACIPHAQAQAVAQPPSFEVASIKPVATTVTGRHLCFPESPVRYRCTGVTVSMIVMQAYGLKSYQFTPYDSLSTQYDVDATGPEGSTPEQMNFMLRSLLAERFKMTSHFEKREMPVYELTVATGGPKLKEPSPRTSEAQRPRVREDQLARDADGFPIRPPQPGSMGIDRANGLGRIVGCARSLSPLVDYLSQRFQIPVIDSTGLASENDYALTFSLASVNEGLLAAAPGATSAPEGSGPTIFAALERQLGLTLRKTKGMIDVFVIDHVEKPTGN